MILCFSELSSEQMMWLVTLSPKSQLGGRMETSSASLLEYSWNFGSCRTGLDVQVGLVRHRWVTLDTLSPLNKSPWLRHGVGRTVSVHVGRGSLASWRALP